MKHFYFPFYPDRWSKGTKAMTIQEKGAYWELLQYQFQHGSIPHKNTEKLCIICGGGIDKSFDFSDILINFPNGVNRTMFEVKEKLDEKSELAKKAVETRYGRNTDAPTDVSPQSYYLNDKDKSGNLNDKDKPKTKGEGGNSPLFLLLNIWKDKNPKTVKASPKMINHAEAAIDAALLRGLSSKDIEAIIWDTAGKGIEPWKLFDEKRLKEIKTKKEVDERARLLKEING